MRCNLTKNGDFLKFEILKNEFVILTLADSVGSKVCDWLAKHLLICVNKKKLSTITIKKIIEKTNQTIINAPNNCKGMMCAFSAIIWNINKRKFYFVSIGDTRIYIFSKNVLTQITNDDTKAILMRNSSGKIMSQSEVTIVREGK